MPAGQREGDTAGEEDTRPGKGIAYLMILSVLFGSCFSVLFFVCI